MEIRKPCSLQRPGERALREMLRAPSNVLAILARARAASKAASESARRFLEAATLLGFSDAIFKVAIHWSQITFCRGEKYLCVLGKTERFLVGQ